MLWFGVYVWFRPGLHGAKYLPFFHYSTLDGRVLVHIFSCPILVACLVSFSLLAKSEIDEGLERPETISGFESGDFSIHPKLRSVITPKLFTQLFEFEFGAQNFFEQNKCSHVGLLGG